MLANIWEEMPCPPKVLSINKAVIALLAEGWDMNSLRVSEITKRAGIGKGTAYEYFSNKEEMIASALEFNLTKLIQNLIEREKDARCFRDMLERMVEWITDNYKSNAGFTILFKTTRISCEVSGELMKAIQMKCRERKETIARMIEQVLAVGEAEGTIQKRNPYYGAVAIISQVIAYSMYLSDRELLRQIPEQEARDFVVESIIKMLN